MALTKPHVQDLANLGIASGFWDDRGTVNFGTGVVAQFDDSLSGCSWTPNGQFAYYGDALSKILFVMFYLIDENHATGGSTSDQSTVLVAGLGSTTSGTYNSVSATGTVWGGIPLGGGLTLAYEGGVRSSIVVSSGGVPDPSEGLSFFVGRIGFVAVGLKA